MQKFKFIVKKCEKEKKIRQHVGINRPMAKMTRSQNSCLNLKKGEMVWMMKKGRNSTAGLKINRRAFL